MSRLLSLLMAGMVLVFDVDAFPVGAPTHLALPFALLGVVVLVGFLQHADHGPIGTIQATTPLIAGLAALAVLGLTRGLAMPVVLSAAAVGSVGGMAEVAARGRMVELGAAVYCGAFAGMTSELVLVHPAGVLLACGGRAAAGAAARQLGGHRRQTAVQHRLPGRAQRVRNGAAPGQARSGGAAAELQRARATGGGARGGGGATATMAVFALLGLRRLLPGRPS